METKKGLFVILDARSCPSAQLPLLSRFVGVLKDFRAMGYRIIGIVFDPEAKEALDTTGFQFDQLERVEGDGWDFPPFAWSAARRFSFNVHRSMLCSANNGHARWAQDAGLRRFTTPDFLSSAR